MASAQDLEFNDDTDRVREKVKEMVRLTQKKMMRSHELIVQFGNSRKECEHLKIELNAAQEEITKLKRESSVKLSNMVKLEMQSTSYKKSQQELERKIEEKDIQIASDKSHLEQLTCKLEDVEEKHVEKVMEAELVRSGLEVNVKELQQELRTLKKSHESEINRLERSLKFPAKGGKKSVEVAKETREMGVNTVEKVEPPSPLKSEMVDKCVLTNEFYHFRHNPYPLFCDRCELIVEPDVEKICRAVVHPMPITNDIPDVWPRDAERQRPKSSESSSLEANRPNANLSNVNRNEPTRTKMNSNDRSRVELNPNESSLVDPSTSNFVSLQPSQSSSVAVAQETRARTRATAVNAVARGGGSLQREVAVLKRKLKRLTTQNTSDFQPVRCCSHAHPVNYCGQSSALANPLPNIFPNLQVDRMTELVNRMISFASKRNSRGQVTKVSSQSKERMASDKKARKKKSRKFEREKRSKNSENCGSSNWNVDSRNCGVENDPTVSADASDPTKPHLLRIKRRHVADSPVTPYNDAASENVSPVSDPWEASFAETQTNSSESVEKISEKARRHESDVNQESTVKVPIATEVPVATKIPGRKRGRPPLRRNNPEIEALSVKNKIVARCLRNAENATKNVPDVNSSENLAVNESSSILSDRKASDPEVSVFSQNSAIGEPAQDPGDAEHSDAPLENVSDSESSLECTNLRDRIEMRKRKRSGSPKAAKRTGRKTLMGKLRALKNNSIMTVAKTSKSSLATRDSTVPSSREDSEEAAKIGKRGALASRNDPGVCLPVKKQRIAHVPKKASSPPPYEQDLPASSKIAKLFDENYKSMDENSKDDLAATATTRPLTRRSAVGKLVQSNAKNDAEGGKGVEISQLRLPASVTEICRRARLPTKRNAAAADVQQSLPSLVKKATAADSPEIKFEKAGETPAVSKVRADPNDDAKSTEASLEGRAGERESNSAEAPESRKDKIPQFAATELAQAAGNSALHSNRAERSMTPSIFTVDAPVDESEVARALPAEKPSDLLDAPPALPAASLTSLDSALSKPAVTSTPPSLSTTSTNAAVIEETNELDALAARSDSSGNKANSAASHETQGDEGQNTTMLSGADSKIPDESPASPSWSPASPDTTSSALAKVTEMTMTTEERPSIYDSAALSIPLEDDDSESTSLSILTAPAENATTCDQLSLQDTTSDLSIGKTFDQSPGADNASLHDDSADEREEFSKNVVNPQFFVEASASAEKNAAPSSNGFAEPNNIKELRSRLVLCSPLKSPSHQNPQRTPRSSDDEAQTAVARGARVSLPENYSRVRSLVTMLNHHLGQQKKTLMTKEMKLRKAAVVKLQKTVEKNVKSELVKLVESDEWTSELHQSVVTKLLNTRNEHAVAKSITGYLIERASLGEPLDQTYTPPAPIMTKCQQKIVTLVTDLGYDDAMPRMFDLVQAGIEYNVFKLGNGVRPVGDIEYLVRIFTVISRIRKDRERVRILCCDVFYFLGRRALPIIHVILTIWPEVMPKHGTVGNELTNCFAHLIKAEVPGKNPFPKVMALKKIITSYYEYPHFQAQSDVVMKVLLNALHEKYSNDLATSILLISKREGTNWVLNNVINKGLMTIIRDDSYQWQYEAVSLLGFLLRCFPVVGADKTLQKYVDLLCHILDSGEGSHDKQEGALSALLSLSRYNSHFLKISDSVLKWTPSQELRASTMEQLLGFFDSHNTAWWKMRSQYKMNTSGKNIRRT